MREAKKEICKERVDTEAERERGKICTSIKRETQCEKAG